MKPLQLKRKVLALQNAVIGVSFKHPKIKYPFEFIASPITHEIRQGNKVMHIVK